MPLTMKLVLILLAIWSGVYVSSAALWEIKRSNREGGVACFGVVLMMLAALIVGLCA